jgi:FMN phosphatase YigB (HAD superfamily)
MRMTIRGVFFDLYGTLLVYGDMKAAWFDPVVVSAEVGLCKPDPRIFRLALSARGLDPAEVVYVGDSDEDVVGARAAGMTPVRLCRDGGVSTAAGSDFRVAAGVADERRGSDDGCCIVGNLDEVSTLLQGLRGQSSRRERPGPVG